MLGRVMIGRVMINMEGPPYHDRDVMIGRSRQEASRSHLQSNCTADAFISERINILKCDYQL